MRKIDLNDSELTQLLQQSWLRIHSLLAVTENQCYRLTHDLKNEFQVDVYGTTIWVYWYKENLISESETSVLLTFSKAKNKNLVIRHMTNRGAGVGGLENKDFIKSDHQPEQWTAEENSILFQLRTTAGFSPGLFLDQSENRLWVLKNSNDKTVLNLFSYTSGFSLAAALGHAKSVTTVDASSSFLNWSKENFKLNLLQPDNYEFFTQDSMLFLSGSKKRNRKWDLLICDPPSFGRTKTTIWKIEKDLPELILKMWHCLSDEGRILFTCNYQKWNLTDLEKIFAKALSGQKYKFEKLPAVSVDFELTDSTQNLTKGFFISKLGLK